MTLELPLSSETDAKIRAHAAAAGQDVEAFVLQALLEKLADETVLGNGPLTATAAANETQWADKLRAVIRLHPVVTHFVDDRRESIYAGRGQ